ncbi:hypothetical protein MHH37_10055 [Solibacillus sp. FSL K6-1781]|uniref:hypothetical protein n=1 Tax=Solibacillus sp. FSL K6-1781 TaxID=2921474 RepID=UPI00315AF71A
MTKWTIVLITAGMLLVGCSDEAVEKNSKAEEETPGEFLQEEEKPNEADQLKDDISEEEAAKLPEYNIIRKQIGDGSYKIVIIANNEETRILHFLNAQGELQYKAVFVKETNRLKIINTKGDGNIFNQVIG